MATPMVEDTSSFEEDQLASMSTEDIVRATRLLDNEIRILKEDAQRTNLECDSYKEKIKENQEKIKLNKQLPYLVGNIVEILEMNPEDDAEEDGANIDLDSQRKGKCVVLKTSTRQTIFLPVVGLVDPDSLKPGDLVGVNKDSYLILDTLPSEYDSRVKAMEVDEKPTEDYNDIGGLEKQIQELVEAIVLPMTHKERFEKLGVRPPKGVLLYGPPGTGKTLMARACAAQTNATFLKLAGPQLVQMFIGDGAKLVRDAFQLAKEKAPCIIFIDEIDAIGTKRFDSEVSGDREVQRTMLELLNQLDGFSSDERIKVIAATNRADILDPALMRSGRLDRKIEFPHPTEEARARILQIHSRKMNVHPDVNFEELARSTDDFNGAQLKAVCVEAGMLALRRDATEVNHEDFNEGIIQVQAKKKANCIGSAFNAKGVMQCPNCRKIEKGQWLYANGCRSHPEFNVEDWVHEEEFFDIGGYSEVAFGVHWCPFGSSARLPSFDDGEFSPSSYHDLLGQQGYFTEPAAPSAGRPCPYVTYIGPVHSSSSSTVGAAGGVSESSSFTWNTGSSVSSEVPAPYGFPVDPHYHSWDYHSPPPPPQQHFSLSVPNVGSPTQPAPPPAAARTSRANGPRPPQFMRPSYHGQTHSSSGRAGSSVAPPFPGSNARTRDRTQALQAYYQQSTAQSDSPVVSRGPVFPSGRRPSRGSTSSSSSSDQAGGSGFLRFNIWEREPYMPLQQAYPVNQMDREPSIWTSSFNEGSGSFLQRHGGGGSS
ncbi:unnamed protein product [Brassica oleracea var. botrytis]